MTPRAQVVVAGVGNGFRGDDGAGPAVARRVAARMGPASAGAVVVSGVDPVDPAGLWDGARLALVVDATRSGAAPGTLRVMELDEGAAPGAGAETGAASTHGVDLRTVLALSRALGQAPRRVLLVGVEGRHFALGAALSPEVAGAVESAAALVLDLVAAERGAAHAADRCRSTSPSGSSPDTGRDPGGGAGAAP